MVISHKHKFAYISISKAGTASVLDALAKYNANKRGHPDFRKKKSMPLHGSVSELLNRVPESEDYFKFCFTRNPFSRIVSVYFQYRKKQGLKSPRRRELYELSNKMPFSDFIKKVNWNEKSMLDYIMVNDNIAIDFIGRQERFEEDFTKVINEHLKLPNINIPYKNVSTEKKQHYSEYYDNESRKIIATRYAKDIKYFKYKFGE